MRFREAVRLARRAGACAEDLLILDRMRSWREFWSYPMQDVWRSWWIWRRLPNPGQPGVWEAEQMGRIPSPAEEPSAKVRYEIAACIQARRIGRIPTPAEEPAAEVRFEIAQRIPAERIGRIPSQDEEPCEDVRKILVQRKKKRSHKRTILAGSH